MAINDSNLNIVVKAKDQASQTLNKFNGNLDKTRQTSVATKAALIGIGVAAVGMAVKLGKEAINSAVAFEKSMSNVSTLIDTNVESMDEMGESLMNISKRVPVALADLTDSLYDVRSAGISAEGAMDVLEQSAVLATSGLGTTKEATDILTSAINAFGLNAEESNKWANVFFEAVKAGKTTVAGLSQGFGQIAPLANEVGVEFEELMGITSAMTVSGLDASIAYTQIRATISNLLKPTKEMQELYEKLDITNIKAKITQDGLITTIRELSDATDGNNEYLAKAFGSVEALNGVMMLNNETGEKAIEITKGMKDETLLMDEAFQKQSETTAAQMQIMQNNIEILKVKIGSELLPVINKVMAAWIQFLSASDSPKIKESVDSIKETNNQLDELIQKRKAAGLDTANLERSLKQGEGIVGSLTSTNPLAGKPLMEQITTNPNAGKPNPTFRQIFGFAEGGVVPGPKGAAQLAMVHGGETITPPDKSGIIINFDLRGATMTDKDFINKVKNELNKTINLNRMTN